MGPARMGLATQERESRKSFDNLVERDRLLAAARYRTDRHLLARGGMKPDRLLDVIAVALRDARDQRQIFLLNLPALELQRQLAMGLVVLGDNDQARGVTVQPMHDAGSALAGQRRECVEV